jgi:SAM-dependent methyltransferase
MQQSFCPACSNATGQRLLFFKNDCEILQCAECGLGRAHANNFDPHIFYTTEYFTGGLPDGYADYLGSESVLRREFAKTVDFIRTYRASGRLLEIGCAYGFFLQEATRYFDVAGIEIVEGAAAFCRQHGLCVLTGTVDECGLERFGTMDVIVLLDVIEHLPSPHVTLALCARYLSPGGLLVITTGDFGSRHARLSGPRWRLMTPPQHLWYFTRDSIRRMSQPHGLCIESCDHPWKVVPLSLIALQVKRMLGICAAGPTVTSRVGVPVNLFDAMRIVLRKTE